MGVIDNARKLLSGGEKRTLHQCNACMETFVPEENDADPEDLKCPVCNDPNIRIR